MTTFTWSKGVASSAEKMRGPGGKMALPRAFS